MSTPPNPFAGSSLTDQTPLRAPGQDQRLFSQQAVPPAEASADPRPPRSSRGMAKKAVTELPDDWVASTVRLLRRPGKESATLRLTVEEKMRLRDLAYTYTGPSKRTYETDLIRVALQMLLADYEAQGELSALARVMKALES